MNQPSDQPSTIRNLSHLAPLPQRSRTTWRNRPGLLALFIGSLLLISTVLSACDPRLPTPPPLVPSGSSATETPVPPPFTPVSR